MVSVVLDIAAVGLIVLFAVIGIARGFIKEIVSLVGIVISLVASLLLSNAIAGFIFDKAVGDRIHTSVANAVSSVGNSGSSLEDALPDYLVNAAGALDIDVSKTLSESTDTSALNADAVADAVVKNIARPVITRLIALIFFIALFIIFRILIRLLANALNVVARLPVLHTANKVLGLAVGLIKGFVFVVILCYAVALIVSFKDNGILGITTETVDKTEVFRRLAGLI